MFVRKALVSFITVAVLAISPAVASALVRPPGFSYTATEYTAGVTQAGHITTGPDGHIWWTAAGYGRISYLDSAGVVHTPGLLPGKFPFGITTGPDGRIWFTEAEHGIGYIDSEGVVHELPEGRTPGFSATSSPSEITAGPDGHVWFTEAGSSVTPGAVAYVDQSNVVHEFKAGQTPGFSAASEPSAITTGPDHQIWFTESADIQNGVPGGVAYIDGNGTVHEFKAGQTPGFSANARPGMVAAGPDGNVWFTEGWDSANGIPGGVAYIDTRGVVHEFTAGVARGFSANSDPSDLTAGPDGHIWFTEFGDPGRVAYIDTCGVHEITAGVTPGFTANGGPTAITQGPDGHIWFTELNYPGRLARLNPPTLIRPELCLIATTGTTISYRDTARATTTFTLLRIAGNRRISIGKFNHTDTPGLNTVQLPRRLHHKKLGPGTYRLSMTASSGGAHSAPATARFALR